MNQPVSVFHRRLRELRRCFFLLAACFALSLANGSAAELPKKTFDIPAGDAADTLRVAAQQAGREIMFPAATVSGVRTTAVKGEFTVIDALERMLAGTTLRLVQDEKSGALAVKRDPAPNAPRAAPVDGDRPNRSPSGAIVTMEEFQVTGSRVGLINQGVIPRQEDQAIYYQVFNREDIELMGATDINEVFRYMPQVADFAMDSQAGLASGFNTFGGNTTRTQIDLRGFGSASTTVLVNGRRMPVVRETQGGGPDIGRIPISAIERVEVLPGAAGGIYGANTMGGVINVILRRDYAGRELSINVGTPTRGRGGREYRITYTEGRTLFKGRGHLTWTFDADIRTQMNLAERPLYREFLNRFLPPPRGDLATFITRAGFSNFLPAPGVIVGRNPAAAAQIAPLNIPGGPANVTFASLPLGQNGANLTPASFVPTANQLRAGEPIGKFPMVNPQNNFSLNANYTHELIKDRLNFYAEAGLGYNYVQNTLPNSPGTLNLTATDPRNPFRTGVTAGHVGQPITLYYLMSDVRGTRKTSERDTFRGVVGFGGKLSIRERPWTWALDGSVDYNRRYSWAFTPTQMSSVIVSRGGVDATARNYYNFFADHEAFPNAAAAAFLPESSFRKNSDYIALGGANLRVNGELFRLPAGTVRASLNGEARFTDYYNDFRLGYIETFVASLGAAPQSSYSPSSTSRTSYSAGGELQIPLLGRGWTVANMHEVSASLAYSYEDPNDTVSFGSSTVGLRFAPRSDLAFRVSMGQGTQIPADLFTQAAIVDNLNATTTTPDPRRGNTPIGAYEAITGGNPNLKPERTRTYNLGVIFQPAWARGLRLNADYGYTRKVDAVQTLAITDLVQFETEYPGRIVRAAPTAGDTALGYAGQVLLLDTRRTNVGYIWSQYLDLRLRYQLAFPQAGTVTFNLSSTSNLDYKFKLKPGIAVDDRLDRFGFPLKYRGVGSVTWRRGQWTFHTMANYVESFRDTDNLTPVDSSATFNLQASYEIPYGTAAIGWRKWSAGTQWTLGCNDLFDYDPPFVASASGFMSRFVDPRGRYAFLRVKKTL